MWLAWKRRACGRHDGCLHVTEGLTPGKTVGLFNVCQGGTITASDWKLQGGRAARAARQLNSVSCEGVRFVSLA